MKLSIPLHFFLLPLLGLEVAGVTLSHSAVSDHPLAPLEKRDLCSAPPNDQCTFYRSCLEEKYHCGASDYPLAYGEHYCNAFSARRAQFSAAGEKWMLATMLCLQQTLVEEATVVTSTCAKVREKAYASHPRCYVESGVCLLPPTDWAQILKTIDIRTLFEVETLKASLDTLAECGEFYQWLLKQGLIEGVKWVTSAWEKILGWFGF